jgi:hypothetical protein
MVEIERQDEVRYRSLDLVAESSNVGRLAPTDLEERRLIVTVTWI